MMGALIARGYPPLLAAGLCNAVYAAERAAWRASVAAARAAHTWAAPGPLRPPEDDDE